MPDEGASELATVANYMEAFGVPADYFEIDLTIARGLDYYTGTVYETAMLDHPKSVRFVLAAVMTIWRSIKHRIKSCRVLAFRLA